jgi:hypothetical protein
MKLDFCAVCGTKEDLHQHHIVPIAISGKKRHNNFEDEDDCTVTLCTTHHDMAHGIKKNRSDTHKNLVRAGIERARQNGVHVGRPSVLTDELRIAIYELKDAGVGVKKICRQVKIGTGTYYRAIREPRPEKPNPIPKFLRKENVENSVENKKEVTVKDLPKKNSGITGVLGKISWLVGGARK